MAKRNQQIGNPWNELSVRRLLKELNAKPAYIPKSPEEAEGMAKLEAAVREIMSVLTPREEKVLRARILKSSLIIGMIEQIERHRQNPTGPLELDMNLLRRATGEATKRPLRRRIAPRPRLRVISSHSPK